MSKPRKFPINFGRIGVNAVDKIIFDWGWLFREQPVSDWGIDAHVEHAERDQPTGRLLALQIKTGSSWLHKREGGFAFYGKPRHLNYWTQHSLPVFVVVHVPAPPREKPTGSGSIATSSRNARNRGPCFFRRRTS